MKKASTFLQLVLMLFLTSCSSNKNHDSAVTVKDINVSTFTEAELEEKYCGDRDSAVPIFKTIAGELNKAWVEVLGKSNTDRCSLFISVDEQGVILKMTVNKCYTYETKEISLDDSTLEKLTRAASPVSVPNDSCQLALVNKRFFRVNYIDWTLGW